MDRNLTHNRLDKEQSEWLNICKKCLNNNSNAIIHSTHYAYQQGFYDALKYIQEDLKIKFETLFQ